jgi:hypothetical protein
VTFENFATFHLAINSTGDLTRDPNNWRRVLAVKIGMLAACRALRSLSRYMHGLWLALA